HYYAYGADVFQSGLLVKYFAPASLSVARSISGENRKVLIESNHPFVLQRQYSMPDPEHWLFNEGDEVCILPKETDASSSGLSRRGVIRSVFQGYCEVDVALGGGTTEVMPVLTSLLLKNVAPGDYVNVLVGRHAELFGLVGEKSGRTLGLIPDDSYTVSVWVDINSVAKTNSKTSLVYTGAPLKDIKVVIVNSDFHKQLTGSIKRMWADGHGSVRVLVYVPTSDCSIELDYTQVIE
ncbi:hypothetical protein FB446DRAFT_604761, partial [Lentinula raphanica]